MDRLEIIDLEKYLELLCEEINDEELLQYLDHELMNEDD